MPRTHRLIMVASLVLGTACGGSVEIEAETDDTTAPSPTSAASTSATGLGSSSGSTVATTSSGGAGGEDGGGGAGGSGSAICEAMALLVLSDPELLEAGGDSVWSPGEQAFLLVRMTNLSGEGNFWYPGVRVTADVVGVGTGETTLFGIEGSATVDLPLQLEAAEDLPSGTDVTLTFSVTTLNEVCPGLDSVELEVTLE